MAGRDPRAEKTREWRRADRRRSRRYLIEDGGCMCCTPIEPKRERRQQRRVRPGAPRGSSLLLRSYGPEDADRAERAARDRLRMTPLARHAAYDTAI